MKVKFKNQLGFSLIELVMTIVLIGIISVVVGRILFQGFQTFIVAQNVLDTDWQGFVAIERLVNDIHAIRSSQDITTATSSALTFNTVDGTNIQYQISGDALVRNTLSVALNVQSITFSYLDKNGIATTVLGNIRYITVSITIAQDNMTSTFTTLVGTRGMQ